MAAPSGPWLTLLPSSLLSFRNLPPPPPVAGQQREPGLMGRIVQRSVPVSEFLLRQGNAPTRRRACSKTLERQHTPTRFNARSSKQTSGKCIALQLDIILYIILCVCVCVMHTGAYRSPVRADTCARVRVYCMCRIIRLQGVEGCEICHRIH